MLPADSHKLVLSARHQCHLSHHIQNRFTFHPTSLVAWHKLCRASAGHVQRRTLTAASALCERAKARAWCATTRLLDKVINLTALICCCAAVSTRSARANPQARDCFLHAQSSRRHGEMQTPIRTALLQECIFLTDYFLYLFGTYDWRRLLISAHRGPTQQTQEDPFKSYNEGN